MTKKSTKKKLATQSNFHSSLKNRLFLVGAVLTSCLVLTLGLMYYFLCGADALERHSLQSRYSDLGIPSSWTISKTVKEPNGLFGSCLTFIDNSCPSVDYDITAKSAISLNDMKHVASNLKEHGYVIERSCLDNSSCSTVFLRAHKGKIAVGASVGENDVANTLFVAFSEN